MMILKIVLWVISVLAFLYGIYCYMLAFKTDFDDDGEINRKKYHAICIVSIVVFIFTFFIK